MEIFKKRISIYSLITIPFGEQGIPERFIEIYPGSISGKKSFQQKADVILRENPSCMKFLVVLPTPTFPELLVIETNDSGEMDSSKTISVLKPENVIQSQIVDIFFDAENNIYLLRKHFILASTLPVWEVCKYNSGKNIEWTINVPLNRTADRAECKKFLFDGNSLFILANEGFYSLIRIEPTSGQLFYAWDFNVTGMYDLFISSTGDWVILSFMSGRNERVWQKLKPFSIENTLQSMNSYLFPHATLPLGIDSRDNCYAAFGFELGILSLNHPIAYILRLDEIILGGLQTPFSWSVGKEGLYIPVHSENLFKILLLTID
jgi:hypothetical protein